MTIQSGYPALLNRLGQAQSRVTLLAADAVQSLAAFSGPQWGLFRNGQPVLCPDSILAQEVRRLWQVCQAPVEQGGFQSCNKVALPLEIRLRMTKGGSAAERAAFLAALDALAADTVTCDVAAPDGTYAGMTFTRTGLCRGGGGGAGLLTVEAELAEVRVQGQGSGLVHVAVAASASPLGLGLRLPGLSQAAGSLLSLVT
ncbi:hypothetical protein GALL_207740 [mine drainage metagenome]|uniref:Uncharacterized protein n=1 Tax=mine drainage metagenome TaxID=410659 RepID=A0A1J5RYQ4_9ZZZZ